MQDQVDQSRDLASVTTENQGAAEAADAVAGLAGRALVAAVGRRVMGWQVFDINDLRDDAWRDDPANYPYLEQYVGTALYTSAVECRLWNPDTEIAAAMEVVEKMHERGRQVEMKHIGMVSDPPLWFVRFDWHPERYSEATGLSLTKTLCRAALQATASA